MEALLIPAFVAGLLTFLAPCTLPLVPAYLGFISGVKESDFDDPEKAKGAQKKIFLNGVFFILGFSIVFVLFGTLAGLLGAALAPYRIWLTRVGGAFVVLFGLFMTGVIKIPALTSEKRFKMPTFLEKGKPSSSLIIGSAFAFGWTPCVGPILGSILLLVTSSENAFGGAMLLAVFSMGLAVPFLLVALAFSKATIYIKSISKYLKVVSIIGGVFLIALGLLLLTDNLILLISYGYRFVDFVGLSGYEEFLLEYL